MPRGGGRGGGNSSRVSNRSNSTEPKSDVAADDNIYCSYCPSGRAAMSKQALAKASFCTNCNSAFHQGCVKRCHMNSDGSFKECCGSSSTNNNSTNKLTLDNEDLYADDESDNYHDSNLSTRHNLNDNSIASLKSFIGTKFNKLYNDLENFNSRINKNQSDITHMKTQIQLLSDKFDNLHNNDSATFNQDKVTNKVFSEQSDRMSRAKNIIVFNLPEFNKETPIDDKEKKKFFIELTEYNNKNLASLSTALNQDINLEGMYSKRIGKFVKDKTRPLRISLSSSNDVKLILHNTKNLSSTDQFKSIVIKPDLTSLQRTLLRETQTKCITLNQENTNNKFFWKIINPYSNPKIIKHSKNSTDLMETQTP